MRRLLDSLLFSGETKSLLKFCWACNLAHVSALQWYPKPVSCVLCSCLWKKFHGVCDCKFDSMHSISTMMVVSCTWFSENLCRDDLLYTSIFYHLEYMICWKFMQRQRSLYCIVYILYILYILYSILYFIIWGLLEASTFTKKKLQQWLQGSQCTWFSEDLCRDDLLHTSIFYHLEYMIFWKFM